MSKSTRVPFFARFIETEAPKLDTQVRAGANGGDPNAVTLKYPSDGEDDFSTFKGGTEYDERW